MTAKCTAQLLADLGVTQSLGRPWVSNDNPYSEAQFKTVKYHPGFPGRFADIEEAKDFCRTFFQWYNTEHRHGGIGLLTPRQVHLGRAPEVIEHRRKGAGCGLRCPARPLRGWPAEGRQAPGGGLDQPRTSPSPRSMEQSRPTGERRAH